MPISKTSMHCVTSSIQCQIRHASMRSTLDWEKPRSSKAQGCWSPRGVLSSEGKPLRGGAHPGGDQVQAGVVTELLRERALGLVQLAQRAHRRPRHRQQRPLLHRWQCVLMCNRSAYSAQAAILKTASPNAS